MEFALVLPILLLLVFGIIQYGLYFWAMQGGADIARGAARLAAVGNAPICADFQADVSDDVDDFGGATGPATVTRTFTKAEGNTDATRVEVGDRVVVTVEFTAIDLNFPFVPFIDNGTVYESVEARVDHVDTQPDDLTCGVTP